MLDQFAAPHQPPDREVPHVLRLIAAVPGGAARPTGEARENGQHVHQCAPIDPRDNRHLRKGGGAHGANDHVAAELSTECGQGGGRQEHRHPAPVQGGANAIEPLPQPPERHDMEWPVAVEAQFG